MGKKLFLLLSIAAVLIATSNAANETKTGSPTETRNQAVCYTPDVKCYKSNLEVIKVGLDQSEKDDIRNLHNNLRNKLKNGEVKPQPAAKRMLPLKWDEDLEKSAQLWANQCNYGRDKCLNIGNQESIIGQNIGKIQVSVYSKFPNGTLSKPKKNSPPADVSKLKVTKIVGDWFNTVADWNKNDTYQKFKNVTEYKGGEKVLSFTQIAWSKTTKIGCGALRYAAGPYVKKLYLVCNYGPGGNVVGERMYIPTDDKQEELHQTITISLLKGAQDIVKRKEVIPGAPINIIVEYTKNNEKKSVLSQLPEGAEVISMDEIKNKNGSVDIHVKFYNPEDE